MIGVDFRFDIVCGGKDNSGSWYLIVWEACFILLRRSEVLSGLVQVSLGSGDVFGEVFVYEVGG